MFLTLFFDFGFFNVFFMFLMTLMAFKPFFCNVIWRNTVHHFIFFFFVFTFPSRKIFLICSYFLTNFSLVVLIKFVITKKSVLDIRISMLELIPWQQFLPCNRLYERYFGKNYYCTSIPSNCTCWAVIIDDILDIVRVEVLSSFGDSSLINYSVFCHPPQLYSIHVHSQQR